MNVDFNEHFRAPHDYNPPGDKDLDGNTQFPNLNSVEFRYRQQDESIRMLPFYELLESNQDQTTILLGTNSHTQRLWNATLFGYKRFSDIGNIETSCIKLTFDSNLTGIRFVDKSMVIFTTARGTIQLWSTQSEIRQKNGYNLFQVSKKSEHFGSITGFDTIDPKKAITGAMDGCIKLWELAPCDLVSVHTYRYAHKEMVTDITSKPQSSDIFASCSRDRVLSIWDTRLTLPMIKYCKNEHFANTACVWLENDGIDQLYVGDDSGTISAYDSRNLNEPLMTQKLLDRPIYKFKLNPDGKLLAVLGQTNTIKVIDAGSNAETIYTNSTANEYTRDVCWVKNQDLDNKKFFYSVGWNKTITRHTIE